MASKIEIYKSRYGWRWRLIAGNGVTVAIGDEYVSKGGAVRGAEAMIRASTEADIVEVKE